MTYTLADVGPNLVDGQEVELSTAEKQAIVDQWNAAEAAKASAPRYVGKETAMSVISESDRNVIIAYMTKAAADDTHTDHAVASNYLNKLLVQQFFNVNSTAWTNAAAWLLARGLIDQSTHDGLTAL